MRLAKRVLLVLYVLISTTAPLFIAGQTVSAARCYWVVKKLGPSGLYNGGTYVARAGSGDACTYEMYADPDGGFDVTGLPNPFPAGDDTCILFPEQGAGYVVDCEDPSIKDAPPYGTQPDGSSNIPSPVDPDSVNNGSTAWTAYCRDNGNHTVQVPPGKSTRQVCTDAGYQYGSAPLGPGYSFGKPCDFDKNFFGLPVWYKYLQAYQKPDTTGACSFDFSSGANGAAKVADASAAVLIGLAVIEILLRLVGLIAVIFVIVGGVKYVLSQGSPDQTKAARNTIINALIGVAIAMLASAIVSFIGKRLGS